MRPTDSFIKFDFEGMNGIDYLINTLLSKGVADMNREVSGDIPRFSRMKGSDVEEYSVNVFKRVAQEEQFDADRIQLISGQTFPDIVIKNSEYGVEVKSTKQDSWKSTGSSIVESTRNADVERIYMLFGKLGGVPEFRCKPYQKCLYDIAVTHSPRYLINMELDASETIFSKMNVDYDNFRLEDEQTKISRVRRYYIQEAQNKSSYKLGSANMPWWMGETGVADWKFYNGLTPGEKKKMWVRMIILFPCLFDSNIKEHYKTVALWLCDRYSLICYNMRDMFTAGGRIREFGGVIFKKGLPAIIGRLIKNLPDIKKVLHNPDTQILMDIRDFWDFDYDVDNLYNSWRTVVIETVKSNRDFDHVPIKEIIDFE